MGLRRASGLSTRSHIGFLGRGMTDEALVRITREIELIRTLLKGIMGLLALQLLVLYLIWLKT